MACTLAVISDIHFGHPGRIPKRKGEFGDFLLKRTVDRLVDDIEPDLVVVLGDCVDDAAAPDVLERLKQLQDILALLPCPVLVLRGNHDPEEDLFYQVFPRPPAVFDCQGVRFLSFLDPERPGYNAERLSVELDQMQTARGAHQGMMVSLQHVPVLPPGTTACPYGYTNVEAVLDMMSEQHISLAVGGHYHRGTSVIHQNGSAYVAVKALCEAPFAFTVMRLDAGEIQVEEQGLQMPPELGLVDTHIHTQYAYCSKDMDMNLAIQLGQLFGLRQIAFTEHTGQLYFERTNFWRGGFCRQGIDGIEGRDERIVDYLSEVQAMGSPFVVPGLEIDCDYHGRPVVLPQHQQQARFINGAQHFLPALRHTPIDPERLADEFLGTLQSFMGSGIDALAHPFRIFERAKLPVPKYLYRPVVTMLREYHVAAEINYHSNTPDPEFFRACLHAGVNLTLGSDAHCLHAIGEFQPHLRFLEELGCASALDQVLRLP